MEESCSQKNEYEEEYMRAQEDYVKKYEWKNWQIPGKYVPVVCMEDIEEYKELYDKYWKRENELGEYRMKCTEDVFDMMKKYFYYLWD